jgi:hypothetical protein
MLNCPVGLYPSSVLIVLKLMSDVGIAIVIVFTTAPVSEPRAKEREARPVREIFYTRLSTNLILYILSQRSRNKVTSCSCLKPTPHRSF